MVLKHTEFLVPALLLYRFSRIRGNSGKMTKPSKRFGCQEAADLRAARREEL